jgi:hypothetical protein
MSRVEELLEAIRELSPEEQRQVREGLESDAFVAAVPPEVQDEIMAEVERRMADPQPLIPWDEALADLRARLARRRAGS